MYHWAAVSGPASTQRSAAPPLGHHRAATVGTPHPALDGTDALRPSWLLHTFLLVSGRRIHQLSIIRCAIREAMKPRLPRGRLGTETQAWAPFFPPLSIPQGKAALIRQRSMATSRLIAKKRDPVVHGGRSLVSLPSRLFLRSPHAHVDRGVPLSEALLMHDKWLEKKGIKHKNFAVVTWSNWDCRVMLESECKFKRIRKPPYFNRWINLKVPFQEMFQGVRCNLKEAVQLAGLTWEGRAHCGLDDARNTARLLVHLMDMGFKFSITNSLMSQTSEFPVKYETSRNLLLDQNQHTQKPKELVGGPFQFHPFVNSGGKERQMFCYCGVLSSKCVVRKPGPTQGRCFFGCGNWTASRRAMDQVIQPMFLPRTAVMPPCLEREHPQPVVMTAAGCKCPLLAA
ncbi:Cytochrome P450, partial [Musa troglodytarum]